MEIIQKINSISAELNSYIDEKDIEEILFLLNNDANLYHLSKTHPRDAITEAILYVSPGF